MVTHQLQVKRRIAKVRWSQTDVLTTVLCNQLGYLHSVKMRMACAYVYVCVYVCLCVLMCLCVGVRLQVSAPFKPDCETGPSDSRNFARFNDEDIVVGSHNEHEQLFTDF